MHVLITGGAGYIGSHTCLELLQAGHRITVVDNLCNSSTQALARVEILSGRQLAFHQVDLCDAARLEAVFAAHPDLEAVIHFAGLKAVGESVARPLLYYQTNLNATLNLCACMARHGVGNLIFSSSATVYGQAETLPLREDHPTGTRSPYGRTKLMSEEILTDIQHAQPEWTVVLLRYFNPVGAHESGQIGEDPRGIPSNLMPYVCQVAAGRLPELAIFGNDYPTPDGTGVRDYLHVVDLARGHVQALEHCCGRGEVLTYNLGTGRGHSVLELVQTFMAVNQITVPYRLAPRRPGDVAACWADPSRAQQELHWQAHYDLAAMCRHAWNWQRQHPHGYGAELRTQKKPRNL